MKRFTEFPLKIDLLEALHDMRFLRCTPIQEKALPVALQGLDVSGMAQTGTGKTLAFLIPILDKLVPDGQVQALVICPTRELAIQVGRVASDLGGRIGAKTSVVYGGTALGHQRKEVFAGPDIVVGTPGRVIDFIRTSVIRLRHLKWLVLDEADRMLDMGFIDDVDFILRSAPPSRQTMLFSATLPPEVLRIASRYMHEPVEVKVSPQTLLADRVEQYVYKVPWERKTDLLIDVLRKEKPSLCLVFTAMREATTTIARRLRAVGFEAGSLSSLQTQRTREGIVRMFKEGEFRVLVATDVAARGLDIDGISHVINFDISMDPGDYVHRIGRTARAGKEGRAITFVSGPQDQRRLQAIEKLTKMEIAEVEHSVGRGRPQEASPRESREGRPGRRRPERDGRRGEPSRGRRAASPITAGPVSASPVGEGPEAADASQGGESGGSGRNRRRRRRRPGGPGKPGEP
jgi:superfamily II DNA/RNA helicase